MRQTLASGLAIAVLVGTAVVATATPSYAATGQRLTVRSTSTTTTCSTATGCETVPTDSGDRDLGVFTAPAGGSVEVELERTPNRWTNTDTITTGECPGTTYTEVYDVDTVAIVVVVRDAAGTELSRTRAFGGSYSEGTRTYRQEEYGRSQETQQCEGPSIFTSDEQHAGSYTLTPEGGDTPPIDCGENGQLDESGAQQLIDAGLVDPADPCTVVLSLDDSDVEVAGPAFSVLYTVIGNKPWAVLDEQDVLSAENRTSRCVRLKSPWKIQGWLGQVGTATVEQRICKSLDPATQRWILTDGTFDTASRTWRPPPRPTVSISTGFALSGFSGGGVGGSGVVDARYFPHQGRPHAGWEGQIQVVAVTGIGVPQSGGLFFGVTRSIDNTFRLTVDDIRDPL